MQPVSSLPLHELLYHYLVLHLSADQRVPDPDPRVMRDGAYMLSAKIGRHQGRAGLHRHLEAKIGHVALLAVFRVVVRANDY